MRYIAIILFLFNVASAQSLFGVVASDGFDADARRYLDSAGITNSSQRAAFNTFVKGMKSNGLWTKAAAIYPFMGGTASSHKWNAKDVRDLDAAYRLSFVNGATHNSNGITFNGSTQYANTFLNSSAVSNSSNGSFAIYNRTNNSGNIADMGTQDVLIGNVRNYLIHIKWSDNNLYSRIGLQSIQVSATNSDATGFYITTRTSSTSLKQFRNGTQFSTTVTTSNSQNLPDLPIFIGALNNQGTNIAFYSNRNYCFAIIMNTGLSDSEASTLSTLVNNLQTALGRNTY